MTTTARIAIIFCVAFGLATTAQAAVVNAAATGNWSSTATWPGGTLPTSSDDVYANNKTVTTTSSAR